LQDRDTLLNHEEQRTVMSLWCIFRSPLIMGGNLTRMDDWTTRLLTNPEVIAVNQHSSLGRQVAAGDNAIAWRAQDGKGGYYLAAFNMGEDTRKLSWTWKQLGLPEASYHLRDLWEQKDMGTAASLSLSVKAHGAALLRATP
jgi:hypothetical protein